MDAISIAFSGYLAIGLAIGIWMASEEAALTKKATDKDPPAAFVVMIVAFIWLPFFFCEGISRALFNARAELAAYDAARQRAEAGFDEAACRREFEAWAKSERMVLTMDRPPHYSISEVRHAWYAWLAARRPAASDSQRREG